MTPLIDEHQLQLEMQIIQAESMGWQPLEEGAYLHHGRGEPEEELVIEVVGLPDASMMVQNVLLLGY